MENSLSARFLPGSLISWDCQRLGPKGSAVVEVTGLASSMLMSVSEERSVELGGAEEDVRPVASCVGGDWRYGMKERTRCSATAGVRLAHH